MCLNSCYKSLTGQEVLQEVLQEVQLGSSSGLYGNNEKYSLLAKMGNSLNTQTRIHTKHYDTDERNPAGVSVFSTRHASLTGLTGFIGYSGIYFYYTINLIRIFNLDNKIIYYNNNKLYFIKKE